MSILKIWISIYGSPSKYFSDNGGEFSIENYHDMCEEFNITVKKTAAADALSNGLVERHIAVLEDMLLRICV